MKWTLLVRDHGRWNYLDRCLTSLDLGAFDRRVLSEDGVDWSEHPTRANYMRAAGWELLSTGPKRHGLSANVAQAWGSLGADDEWVFDVESDFVVLDAPLEEMAATIKATEDIAQMALVRQPWSPEEHAAGGLLYGPNLQGDVVDEGGWLRQKRIFTLNPYVARASLLRSLQPSVEEDLTVQCIARGLSFGYWGSETDEPRVLHIGAESGMHSPGWKP